VKYTEMVPKDFYRLNEMREADKLTKIVEYFRKNDKKRTGLAIIFNGHRFMLGKQADSYVNRRVNKHMTMTAQSPGSVLLMALPIVRITTA